MTSRTDRRQKTPGAALPAARARYALLDELRGAALLCMVVYHAFYLLADVFHSAAGHKLQLAAAPAQPFIAGAFILISGICSRLSRSNAKRGIKLLAAALLLTGGTYALRFFGVDELITFGVLHFLAVAILLFAPLRRAGGKIPAAPQIVCFAALFVTTVGPFYRGQPGFGFGHAVWLRFPYTAFWPLFCLGFPSRTLDSADYIPLIPWLFLFFAGTAVGIYARQGRFPKSWIRPRCKPLGWLGRHSLLLYLLHQPALFLLFALWRAFFG
ncbi:MAG: DUF1624 domain-containing protein [Oscillospiraceae bacterium]|jgi:uncharacterized membrane protein|nr:DUF1624 domain-containing protein [Oscillospiraceae bacterium]